MMHDTMMMHKRKRSTNNLIGVLPGAVTIDTTNKGSRPEIPRPGTGERYELSDLLRLVNLLDTTNKNCCSMLIG